MIQLRLFPPPSPLLATLGEGFFRAAPRSPGVYIMTGQAERVLYIGQSKNLRARLGSYKNAKPDRAPRKVIRLIHQVKSIVWEKCDSSEAAKLRETELLRLHRPKFNVANTWPAPARFLVVRCDESLLELDCLTVKNGTGSEEVPGKQWLKTVSLPQTLPEASAVARTWVPTVQAFGPFKSSIAFVYAALARSLFSLLNPGARPGDLPSGWFNQKPPRPVRVRVPQAGTSEVRLSMEELNGLLCGFLKGENDRLIQLLNDLIPVKSSSSDDPILNPPASGLSGTPSFQSAVVAHDTEVLSDFFEKQRRRFPA